MKTIEDRRSLPERLWRRVFHNECEKTLDMLEEMAIAGRKNVDVMNMAANEIDRLNTENTTLRLALVNLVEEVDFTSGPCLVAAEKLLQDLR